MSLGNSQSSLFDEQANPGAEASFAYDLLHESLSQQRQVRRLFAENCQLRADLLAMNKGVSAIMCSVRRLEARIIMLESMQRMRR